MGRSQRTCTDVGTPTAHPALCSRVAPQRLPTQRGNSRATTRNGSNQRPDLSAAATFVPTHPDDGAIAFPSGTALDSAVGILARDSLADRSRAQTHRGLAALQ